MREQYIDAEIAALREMGQMFADELNRIATAIIAYQDHLVECENEEHREWCVTQLRMLNIALLDHCRYASWCEAELSKTRLFLDPAKVLREFKLVQEEAAKEAARANGKVYEGELSKTDESAEMDAKATVKGPDTLQ